MSKQTVMSSNRMKGRPSVREHQVVNIEMIMQLERKFNTALANCEEEEEATKELTFLDRMKAKMKGWLSK
jgi:hypothetical protein